MVSYHMHDLSFPFSEIEDLANFLNQPQEPIAFDLFSNLKFVLDSTPNSREIVYNNSDLLTRIFKVRLRNLLISASTMMVSHLGILILINAFHFYFVTYVASQVILKIST